MDIDFIRNEYRNHLNEYLYKIFTGYDNGEAYFKIVDINPDRVLWSEFVCNFNLYQKSLEDCKQSVFGTRHPIVYKGENINEIKESPFLRYNPNTGEIYREYVYC